MKFIQRFGAILLIIAATLVVYAPAIRNGFVWDDTALVLRDPLIRSWRLIPEGFRHLLFLDATGSNFYRPMQRFTYVADYAAWGFDRPGGWHFTSIAVHAATAIALFALLRRWWGERRRPWALAVALIWAIHPLHTSAVTYVSGRADLLAALFGFVGLACTLASVRDANRTSRMQLAAGACFLCAILSKESGGIFLAIAVAFLAWHRIARKQWLQWALILAAVLGSYSVLRFSAHKTPPPPSRAELRTDASVAIAARAVAEYTGLIVAPVTLTMERDVSTPQTGLPDETQRERILRSGQTALGFIVTGAAVLWFLWARRRAPDGALALLACAIAYLPISNLIPLNATVAEHWLYVPSAFLFAAAAASLEALHFPRRVLVGAVSVWAVALAVRTWQRQADWHDQRTFLTRTIEAGGDSARMHVNLGNLDISEGRLDSALAEYAEALRRQPSLSFAHLGMAGAQLRRKHFKEARSHLEQAEASPGLTSEKLQLRTALDAAEKQIDPVPGYRTAAELSPLNWTFRRRYLAALAATGRLPEAIRELREFLQQQDFRADSWMLLAQFLDSAEKPQLAAAAREEAHKRDVRLR